MSVLLEIDGLNVATEERASDNVFLEIKPDGLIIRRLMLNDATPIIEEFNKTGNKPANVRVRKLEKGDNAGTLIAEQVFESLKGFQLISLKREERFGRHYMALTLNNYRDNQPNIVLKCVLMSESRSINRFASSFIDKIPNIKIGTPLSIIPYSIANKGSDWPVKGLTIQQNNSKLESYFFNKETKSNINGKPQPIIKLDKLTGKNLYDWTDVNEFQIDLFDKFAADISSYWNSDPKVSDLEEDDVMPF